MSLEFLGIPGIPCERLHHGANQDNSLDANQRTSILVDMSSKLPYEDKEPFEMVLTRLLVRKGAPS
jgi:hypothetical protein